MLDHKKAYENSLPYFLEKNKETYEFWNEVLEKKKLELEQLELKLLELENQ